jgi:hypothetical protein
VLGLPLFIASVAFAERRGIAPAARWIADAAIAVLLILLYRTSIGWTDQLASLRFAQLLLAGHLLVATAPFATSARLDGFWQFNRILLLRFLLAAVYAGVLWIGLAVALAALDKLFGVKVPGESFARLWAVLALGFHPWFFLSGVPHDYAELERRDDYPSGLKLFTQFVLMPLVVVYLVILTAYLGKVIVTRTWPNGWIGYLVSSVSATGVLALLLVHPLRERADSRWVNGYGRWWFVALLPSLGMLLAAIAKRVGQYGITEPRYFLLVLALWLTALALYYGVTASRNITLIPLTLCAVALLTFAGPWSAYAVGRRSQINRFSHMLAANQMGRPGAITPAGNPVSAQDRSEMSAVLRYLDLRHGPEVVARVVGVPADSARAWRTSTTGTSDSPLASAAMRKLGLEYVGRWEPREAGDTSFRANVAGQPSLDLTGFEVGRQISYPALGWIGTAVDSLELSQGSEPGTIVVKHTGTVVITLAVGDAIQRAVPADSLIARRGFPLKAPIVIDGSGQGYRVRLLFHQVNGQIVAGIPTIQKGSGLLLAAGLMGPR